MLKDILIAGAGSFIGGSLRFAISHAMAKTCTGLFPAGTFIINIAGCFLIGIIYGILSRYAPAHSSLLLFLTTGLCGGFTTFSTFARENVLLLQNGQYLHFMLYAAGSLVLGIGAVILGNWAVKLL